MPSHDDSATASPDVLQAVDDAIARLQSHADSDVREATQTLLEGIDAVHRAGLTHLVQAVHAMAGEAFLNRLIAAPPIRLLLMSYNLVAVDRRLQAEEALDTVRGHLHDHGIDVVIHGVVGGVVNAQLHHRQGAGLLTSEVIAASRRDIEAAMLEHFVGFQELVLGDRQAPSGTLQHISLETLRRGATPIYHDALDRDTVAEGGLAALDVDDVPILVARVDGEIYAIRNRCGDSPLPLEFGVLAGSVLTCSWHGCRYDVRSGHRTDGEVGSVQVFPVRIDADRIQIALGVRRPEAVP